MSINANICVYQVNGIRIIQMNNMLYTNLLPQILIFNFVIRQSHVTVDS